MAVEDNQLKRQKWLHIRNLGNHEHNCRLYKGEESCSDLIARKRPTSLKSIHDYVGCSDCVGYFFKGTLWIHKKSCPQRRGNAPSQNHVKEGIDIMPINHDVSSSLKKHLACMKQDDIALIVRNDTHILKVGEHVISASNSARKGESPTENENSW